MLNRFLSLSLGALLVTAAPVPNATQSTAIAAAASTSPADPLQGRKTPAWFDEAKLGIFIHWNAASIPAYAPVTSWAALELDNARDTQSDPLWSTYQPARG